MKIALNGSLNGAKSNIQYNDSSAILYYPCESTSKCIPYKATLEPGRYKFELWGAQGGKVNLACNRNDGGKGGYSSGELILHETTDFYIHIGHIGAMHSENKVSAYNGGGSSSNACGGGGATDVRLSSLAVDATWSIYSRIMVAGGGGGTDCDSDGGAGGGVNGLSSSSNQALGGGQQSSGSGTSGSNLWKGGSYNSGDPGAGGGGGYYGGQLSMENSQGGAGGSGFVSGHPECIAIKDDGTPSESSIHYSQIYFLNPVLRTGDDQITSPLGENITGNSGNGAAKITKLTTIQYSCKRSDYNMLNECIILIYIYICKY